MALPDIAVGDLWTADAVQSLPQGVVYQGNRSTASSTTSGTTALGILRIDNMVLKAGYAYNFVCGNIRATIATPGANFKLYLAYSSSGAATTASSEIGKSEQNPPNSTWNWPRPDGWVVPGTTTSAASILLAIVRTNSAAASTFVTLADTGGLWLSVIDYGVAVSDTGVDV